VKVTRTDPPEPASAIHVQVLPSLDEAQ